MLGRWAVSIGIAAGLTACAGAQAPLPVSEVSYLPPTSPPARGRTALVQQPPFLIWGNLVDRLQQSDLEVTQLDEGQGYVVAHYSGDPEPYVNCGWIVRYGSGGLEQVPAATPEAAFSSQVNGTTVELNRDLRLDGRLVVQVEPDGSGSAVTTRTTYVLTKIIDAQEPDGELRGRHRETISFETGEAGEFTKGTQCQPTGALERVVLDSLPPTTVVRSPEPETTVAARTDRGADVQSLAEVDVEARVETLIAELPCADVEPRFGAGNQVRLAGYVSREQDAARLRQELEQLAGAGAVETAALEVQPWPFCEILQITEPYREVNEQNGAQLDVAVADGGGEILREGQRLALEVGLPPEANYLYLGYIQEDGRVGHIGTMPAREWASTVGRIRYDTGFEVAEPYGREMIVAITSERPLFDEARPAYEAPEQFVAALRQELSNLAASDPDQMIAASHLFITTQGNDVR